LKTTACFGWLCGFLRVVVKSLALRSAGLSGPLRLYCYSGENAASSLTVRGELERHLGHGSRCDRGLRRMRGLRHVEGGCRRFVNVVLTSRIRQALVCMHSSECAVLLDELKCFHEYGSECAGTGSLLMLCLVLFSALEWRDPRLGRVRRTRSWLMLTEILPSGGVFTIVWAAALPREFCGHGGRSVICVVGLRSQALSFGGTSTAELAWLSPSGGCLRRGGRSVILR
jgi:hypothetical protein